MQRERETDTETETERRALFDHNLMSALLGSLRGTMKPF